MKKNQSRRSFLKKSTTFCVACGALAAYSGINTMGNFLGEDDIPDPKKLNYCSYICPPDCPMKKATMDNDIALKEKTYKDWRIEEKYGIAFDPEQLVCFGCKTDTAYKGIAVENCTVRNCSIEKGYDCCIECKELAKCEKEIWIKYPDFHKSVIEMQAKYQET